MSSQRTALKAYIALGSNLGDSAQTLRRAMERLSELSDQPLVKSSIWKTTPVDCPPGSPLFLNAVVGLLPRPEETPLSLLEKLHGIERSFGRTPKRILNEARTLDLDLIVFGSTQMETNTLILPHPRAHLRRFVLQPLSEIAPEFILPGQSKTVSELLGNLQSDEVVEKLK